MPDKILFKGDLMALLVKKLDDRAILPKLAHDGDIGYDLFALEDTEFGFGWGVHKVRTGVAIEFTPSAGAKLETRSSMALKGIQVVGGVIDSKYTGEIVVLLAYRPFEKPYRIRRGDKIAQLIRVEIPHDEVVEVEKLTETVRGAQGFGSSGR